MRRLEKLLRPFFDKYDDDKSGQLDRGEFWSVFHDLQEHVQTQVSAFGGRETNRLFILYSITSRCILNTSLSECTIDISRAWLCQRHAVAPLILVEP